MNTDRLQLLLVEDNPHYAAALQEALSGLGEPLDIAHVERLEQAAEHLQRGAPADAILLDLMLPDSNGLVTLDRANAVAPHLPIIVLTGSDDESLGVEAVRKGAQDYLVKGQISLPRLLQTVHHSIERKRLEEALLSAAQQWQATFDAVGDAVFLLDDDQRIRRSNRAAQTLFGKSAAEMEGRLCCEIIHGTAAPIPECPVLRIRHSLRREAMELAIDDRHFTVTVDPVLDAHGKLAGAVHVISDITERKRAENALKTVNETLEQRVTERTKAIQMLHDVASMANRSQNAEQAIEYCLRQVAMFNGWCFGHALLPAADNSDELVPAHAWYAEDPERFRPFREVTFGLRLRRGQGLPGRVFASGNLEWTTDLRSDLIERRAHTAEELGIGTAVAVPVLLGEKVAAVLEFFSDQVIHPNGKIADAMVGVGMQLGRVIERVAFEEYLLTTADDVRRGIAQDLHDDVGQELTGLGLLVGTLATMLTPAATPATKVAAKIAAAIDRTHDKVRGLSRGMVPIELEEGLLAAALEELAATTSGSSRIRSKFTCTYPEPVFDSRVSVYLYRIAQEAVANALRHSRAHRIRITLAQENGETVLRIEDDGKGLSAEAARTEGLGLRTMRYRAGLIGGKMEIGPGPSGGTQVVCRLAAPPKIRNPKTNWRRS